MGVVEKKCVLCLVAKAIETVPLFDLEEDEMVSKEVCATCYVKAREIKDQRSQKLREARKAGIKKVCLRCGTYESGQVGKCKLAHGAYMLCDSCAEVEGGKCERCGKKKACTKMKSERFDGAEMWLCKGCTKK